jgi:hypothetical protein
MFHYCISQETRRTLPAPVRHRESAQPRPPPEKNYDERRISATAKPSTAMLQESPLLAENWQSD